MDGRPTSPAPLSPREKQKLEAMVAASAAEAEAFVSALETEVKDPENSVPEALQTTPPRASGEGSRASGEAPEAALEGLLAPDLLLQLPASARSEGAASSVQSALAEGLDGDHQVADRHVAACFRGALNSLPLPPGDAPEVAAAAAVAEAEAPVEAVEAAADAPAAEAVAPSPSKESAVSRAESQQSPSKSPSKESVRSRRSSPAKSSKGSVAIGAAELLEDPLDEGPHEAEARAEAGEPEPAVQDGAPAPEAPAEELPAEVPADADPEPAAATTEDVGPAAEFWQLPSSGTNLWPLPLVSRDRSKSDAASEAKSDVQAVTVHSLDDTLPISEDNAEAPAEEQAVEAAVEAAVSEVVPEDPAAPEAAAEPEEADGEAKPTTPEASPSKLSSKAASEKPGTPAKESPPATPSKEPAAQVAEKEEPVAEAVEVEGPAAAEAPAKSPPKEPVAAEPSPSKVSSTPSKEAAPPKAEAPPAEKPGTPAKAAPKAAAAPKTAAKPGSPPGKKPAPTPAERAASPQKASEPSERAASPEQVKEEPEEERVYTPRPLTREEARSVASAVAPALMEDAEEQNRIMPVEVEYGWDQDETEPFAKEQIDEIVRGVIGEMKGDGGQTPEVDLELHVDLVGAVRELTHVHRQQLAFDQKVSTVVRKLEAEMRKRDAAHVEYAKRLEGAQRKQVLELLQDLDQTKAQHREELAQQEQKARDQLQHVRVEQQRETRRQEQKLRLLRERMERKDAQHRQELAEAKEVAAKAARSYEREMARRRRDFQELELQMEQRLQKLKAENGELRETVHAQRVQIKGLSEDLDVQCQALIAFEKARPADPEPRTPRPSWKERDPSPEQLHETVQEPEPEEASPRASDGAGSPALEPEPERTASPKYLDLYARLLSTEAALDRSQLECDRQAKMLRSMRRPAEGGKEELLVAQVEDLKLQLKRALADPFVPRLQKPAYELSQYAPKPLRQHTASTSALPRTLPKIC